jgi:beta-lactam-binding protein with PASTA domain
VPGPYQGAAPPAAQPEAILLALRLPDDEGYAGGTVATRVEPGGRAVILALVRNQSGIVDNYDLSVRGLPEGWWTIEPATLYLVPYGAAGGAYEQEAEVRLHPPRAAEAEARDWSIAVVARSRAYDQEIGASEATLEIAPYGELETDLSPERRAGRLKADFTLGVRNKANAPVELALAGVDPENACRFTFREPTGRAGIRLGQMDAANAVQRLDRLDPSKLDPEQMGKQAQQMGQQALASLEAGEIPGARFFRRRSLTPPVQGLRVEPGERVEASVSVSPPRQRWIGRSVLHPFQVTVQPAGTDRPGPPGAGTFRQKPWLPWWLLVVAPLVVLLVAWLLSRGGNETTVPDLKGTVGRLEVEKKLQAANLALAEPVDEQQTDQSKPTTVLDQAPEPGKKVRSGSQVSVTLAVGSGKVPVPDVTGQTVAQATGTLAAAGFQAVPPSGVADPTTATVGSEVPPAKTPVGKGTSVQLYLAQAPTTTGAGTSSAPTTGTAPSTAPATTGGAPTTGPSTTAGSPSTPRAPAGAGAIPMPALVGRQWTGLGALLTGYRLTLNPQTASAIFSDTVAPGKVASQDPPPGAPVIPGKPITVTLSAGFPDVLYDAGGDVFRIRGSHGQDTKDLLSGSMIDGEPSISPDQKTLVFQRGPCCQSGFTNRPSQGQIWAAPYQNPQLARPLTNAGFLDQRPAISPDGKVVAFVRAALTSPGVPSTDFDLCFARTDRTNQRPSCIVDPTTSVDRPAWSPDGRAIVVTTGLANNVTELQLYTSTVPNSGSQSMWQNQGVKTQSMHPARAGSQVASSAFSPDGTELAFTANWRGRAFILWLAPYQNGQLGRARPVPRLQACELAWRSDGRELVVSQRGTNCDGPGQVVRVAPTGVGSQTLTAIGKNAGDPVFTPLGR